jgi:ankyrin repeat-rich membrane spanning protein
MDTTTSIKMTTLAIQNLFSYVEEENLAALKAHLDKFKEVDGRSDVSILILSNRPTGILIYL